MLLSFTKISVGDTDIEHMSSRQGVSIAMVMVVLCLPMKCSFASTAVVFGFPNARHAVGIQLVLQRAQLDDEHGIALPNCPHNSSRRSATEYSTHCRKVFLVSMSGELAIGLWHFWGSLCPPEF